MKSIIITGGAGFLGSSLAVAIRKVMSSPEIIAFDNLRRRGSELNLKRLHEADVTFVHGDIRNREDFEALPPADFLLECSADPSVLAGYRSGPGYVINTNLFGTANCLEYARKHQIKVIFVSTSRVYPIDRLNSVKFIEEDTRFFWTDEQETPGVSSKGVTEEFPLQGPRSMYGMTKLASEMLLEEYGYAYGLRYIINRCGVLAGPWQMGKIDQGILGFWVICHIFQKPVNYVGFGGKGKQVRDFLHVDDLSNLVLEQVERFNDFEGQMFNVGGGLEFSVSLCELTDLCQEATGNKIHIGSEVENRTADVRIYLSDCTKLFSKTSWRPKKTAHETIADITKWVINHADGLKSILL